MPLIVQQHIGKSGKLGVWSIQEDQNTLLNELNLSEIEKHKLNSIHVLEKKIQWLCCKKIVCTLAESNFEIYYDDFGKPFLKNTTLQVSFSHTKNYCAVTFDTKNTGVDIEMIRPSILKIKEKFLSATELKSLSHKEYEALEKAHIYWGAKEAMYKAYGKKELLFAEQIHVDDFKLNDKGELIGKILTSAEKLSYKLTYQKLKDSILVYIIND